MSTAKANAIPKYSHYTTALKKEIRKAKRFICYVKDDADFKIIYIMTDNVLVRMGEEEYNAFVRPVVECDAGNYSVKDGEVTPQVVDLSKKLSDAAKDAVFDLKKAPLEFRDLNHDPKASFAAYYNKDGDFATVINTAYDTIVDTSFVRKTSGSESVVVVFNGGALIAMIAPIYIRNNNIPIVIRQWFQGAPPTQAQIDSRISELESERDALQAKYADLQGRYEKLNRENVGLHQEYCKTFIELDCLKADIERQKGV